MTLSTALDRLGKLPILAGIRLIREHDVMDLPRRLGCVDRIDQFGIAAARPRPAADLAQRLLVDSDQDDVAAGRALVDVIADDAQRDLRDIRRAPTRPNSRPSTIAQASILVGRLVPGSRFGGTAIALAR